MDTCSDAGALWLFCELGLGVLSVAPLLLVVALAAGAEGVWRTLRRSRDDADHDV